MKLLKFSFTRAGILLTLALFGYHKFIKEPIVYEEVGLSQACAAVDSLEGNHLIIEGVPSVANYFFGNDGGPFQIPDDNGISFVLKGEGNSNMTCYAGEQIRDEETYSRTKAFIDYHSQQGNTFSLKGKMKKDHFDFKLPSNLEDMLLTPSGDK